MDQTDQNIPQAGDRNPWETLLFITGWFLKITGCITLVLGGVALITSIFYYPTLKDLSSALLSMCFGWGDFYFGGKVIEVDKRGLIGVLWIQAAIIVSHCLYMVWGVPATPIHFLKAFIIIVLVYAGYRKALPGQDLFKG